MIGHLPPDHKSSHAGVSQKGVPLEDLEILTYGCRGHFTDYFGIREKPVSFGELKQHSGHLSMCHFAGRLISKGSKRVDCETITASPLTSPSSPYIITHITPFKEWKL